MTVWTENSISSRNALENVAKYGKICVFCQIKRQNAHFFEKKLGKSLVVQKKAVPLQPHLGKCS